MLPRRPVEVSRMPTLALVGPTTAAADTAHCSSACSWYRPAQRPERLLERRRHLVLRPTSTWCGRKHTHTLLVAAVGTRDTMDEHEARKAAGAGAQRGSTNRRPTTKTKRRSYSSSGIAASEIRIPCWEFRPSGSGPPRGGGSPSSPPRWRRAHPRQLQRRHQPRGLHVRVPARHMLPVIVPPGIPALLLLPIKPPKLVAVGEGTAAGGFYEFPAAFPSARTTITPGVAILPVSASEAITTTTAITQRPPSEPSSIPAPRSPSCPPRRPRGPGCSTCWTGATPGGPPASARAASWAVFPPDVPPSSWAKERKKKERRSPCPVPRSPSSKGMA